jgi:hypothetical protein
MLDTEGEVAFISVSDSSTKIVSKDFGPHRHCVVNSIPKNKRFVFQSVFYLCRVLHGIGQCTKAKSGYDRVDRIGWVIVVRRFKSVNLVSLVDRRPTTRGERCSWCAGQKTWSRGAC